MCTLSWQYSPAGLDLFFNRDESLQRPEAVPPVIEHRDGLSTVMPKDPAGGGTWIAANSQGVILALLNNYRYPSRVPAGQATSRGLLVRRLSSAHRAAEVRAFLGNEPLFQYPPFILLVFNGEHSGPSKWEWTGETLKETRELSETTVSSSSLMPRVVPALRRYLVRQALKRCEPGQAAGRLMDLHRNKHGWPDSLAIAMKRKGRATVSLSHIRVTETDLTFRYWPGFPGSNKCAAGVSVLQRPGSQARTLNKENTTGGCRNVHRQKSKGTFTKTVPESHGVGSHDDGSGRGRLQCEQQPWARTDPLG
jgi:Uncharacterized conserved protein